MTRHKPNQCKTGCRCKQRSASLWRYGRSGRDRFLERDPLCHFGGMLIAQMTVGAHGQRATVLVAQPARDRRNVHTGLDTARGKQVPQVMVGDPRHANSCGCTVYGLLAFTNAHDRRIIRLIRSFRAERETAGLKIIVGGYPFRLVTELWKQVGADTYAETADDAVAIADRLVPVRR